MKRTLESNELFKQHRLPSNYEPPIVVACDIKTPENMGNIIRLCDNIQCKELFFVTNREHVRVSKIKRTAASSYKHVNWGFCEENELKNKIPAGYTWVAIETASDSENIYKATLPAKLVFFVGNEISGISGTILAQCHTIVHIPVYGHNTSLNVSHALAIALFEWQKRITGL